MWLLRTFSGRLQVCSKQGTQEESQPLVQWPKELRPRLIPQVSNLWWQWYIDPFQGYQYISEIKVHLTYYKHSSEIIDLCLMYVVTQPASKFGKFLKFEDEEHKSFISGEYLHTLKKKYVLNNLVILLSLGNMQSIIVLYLNITISLPFQELPDSLFRSWKDIALFYKTIVSTIIFFLIHTL